MASDYLYYTIIHANAGGGLKCSWLTPNSLNVIKAMTTDLLTISFAKPTSVFFNRQTQTIG